MSMQHLDVYKGKKVLITGHTGFKGAWLSEWLMLLGADVIGYSLEPPTSPSLYEQLALGERIAADYREDICNLEKFTEVLSKEKPDFLFHMAAQSIVGTGYDEPVSTFNTNFMGTVNILEALRHADGDCVAILITTDKVYENREWLHSYRENDRLGGYDPYSASKGCSEIAISSYKRSFLDQTHKSNNRKSVASVRAGNVIGGGDWALDRIVPDCIRSLASDNGIPVRNKIATRPWQHVLEPLSGYLLLASRIYTSLTDNDLVHCQDLCSPFNFGPNIESNKTVKELVEKILSIWPGKWEDKSDPNARHEAGKLNLSSEKAFHLLGWQPRWDFDETIEKTIYWYREASKTKDCEQIANLTQAQITEYMS